MRLTPSLLVLAVLALTGCTSAPLPTASPEPRAGGQGPLAPYEEAIGLAGGDGGAFARDLEERVVQCLAEQGWDVPFDPEKFASIGVDPRRPDDEAWVARWGYAYWLSTEEKIELWGYDPDAVPFEETLSPSELEAYTAARYGTGNRDDWRSRGCMGAAYHELGGDPDVSDEHIDLINEAYNLHIRVDSDPRVAELEAEWAACMAELGYGFTTFRDAPNSVTVGLPGALDTDAERERLHAEEIAVALDDLRCRESVGAAEVYRAVRVDVEQRFVDENRAELDAMLAEYLARQD